VLSVIIFFFWASQQVKKSRAISSGPQGQCRRREARSKWKRQQRGYPKKHAKLKNLFQGGAKNKTQKKKQATPDAVLFVCCQSMILFKVPVTFFNLTSVGAPPPPPFPLPLGLFNCLGSVATDKCKQKQHKGKKTLPQTLQNERISDNVHVVLEKSVALLFLL